MPKIDRPEVNGRLKDYFSSTLKKWTESADNHSYRIDQWTKRFMAARSIAGMQYGDDSKIHPKVDPFDGCSDTGIPIEAITIRAIVGRIMKAVFTNPVCNVHGRGVSDPKNAKVIEEYNDYSLNDEMQFKRKYYDSIMNTCLDGDGYRKLIERDEDYEYEEEYFTLVDPMTGEPQIDPQSQTEDNPAGYPVEVPEKYQPVPDPVTGIAPILQKTIAYKKEKIYFGTDCVIIPRKHIIIPPDEKEWDVQELSGFGHRFWKPFYWLKEREGKPSEGGYENVDMLKQYTNPRDPDVNMTDYDPNKRIMLIEWRGKFEIYKNKSPREIIALYAPEEDVLLGWIVNPYKGNRHFYHDQIMPLPNSHYGMGIPQFAWCLRNLIDALVNQFVDRNTLDMHSPILYDEESTFDPDVYQLGLNEFWPTPKNAILGRLPQNKGSEEHVKWLIEFTLGLIQKLFGVNDYTLGSESNVSSNKTARGILAIIGEGNISFAQMITILQLENARFFAGNISMTAKMLKESGQDKKVFFVTESQDNPYREISANQLSLKYNFIPRGTADDINQEVKYAKNMELYNVFMKTRNPFFDPNFAPESAENLKILTQNILDGANIRGIKLPEFSKLVQSMQNMQAQAMKQAQQQMQQEQQKEEAKKRAKAKVQQDSQRMKARDNAGNRVANDVSKMIGGGNVR